MLRLSARDMEQFRDLVAKQIGQDARNFVLRLWGYAIFTFVLWSVLP